MWKTTGERLRYLMERLNLDQAAIAQTLGLHKPSVSRKVNNHDGITMKDARKLNEAYGVSITWLLSGEGEMIPEEKLTVVQEPDVIYTTARGYSIRQITNRFCEVVFDYMQRNFLTQKELAARWGIDATYLNHVINKSKEMSITLLIAAAKHGNVNANYIISGFGGYYNAAHATELKQILDLMRTQTEELNNLKKQIEGEKRA